MLLETLLADNTFHEPFRADFPSKTVTTGVSKPADVQHTAFMCTLSRGTLIEVLVNLPKKQAIPYLKKKVVP